MRDIFALFLHAIAIIIRLARPGGLRSMVAESVLMRHQVLILNRGRKRAPHLRSSDRIIAGLCTLLMRPARVLRSAVLLKPSTLLHFHTMLTKPCIVEAQQSTHLPIGRHMEEPVKIFITPPCAR
jgi:putative transposase